MPLHDRSIIARGWCPFQRTEACGSRRGREQVGVVVHSTGGLGGRPGARWMRESGVPRSYHAIGFRDGAGVQHVPLDLEAWHAGESEWRCHGETVSDANCYTAGLALANAGLLHPMADGGLGVRAGGRLVPYHGPEPVRATLTYLDTSQAVTGLWEPYTEPQLRWLEQVLTEMDRRGWATELVGHDEIAMPLGRKHDPGPLFPWPRFARWRTLPPRTSSSVEHPAPI